MRVIDTCFETYSIQCGLKDQLYENTSQLLLNLQDLCNAIMDVYETSDQNFTSSFERAYNEASNLLMLIEGAGSPADIEVEIEDDGKMFTFFVAERNGDGTLTVNTCNLMHEDALKYL